MYLELLSIAVRPKQRPRAIELFGRPLVLEPGKAHIVLRDFAVELGMPKTTLLRTLDSLEKARKVIVRTNRARGRDGGLVYLLPSADEIRQLRRSRAARLDQLIRQLTTESNWENSEETKKRWSIMVQSLDQLKGLELADFARENGASKSEVDQILVRYKFKDLNKRPLAGINKNPGTGIQKEAAPSAAAEPSQAPTAPGEIEEQLPLQTFDSSNIESPTIRAVLERQRIKAEAEAGKGEAELRTALEPLREELRETTGSEQPRSDRGDDQHRDRSKGQ